VRREAETTSEEKFMRATTAAAWAGVCAFGLSASTWSASAGAQEEEEEEQPAQAPLPAPSNTFELKLGTGYTQGVGKISPGRTIPSVAGAGVGLSLDLDYRINPLASVGVETQYQEFSREGNLASRGVATNVGATVHVSPNSREEPWFRIGTGYRLLWDVNPFAAPNDSFMYHGFDLLTAKVGYDFRRAPGLALAPVIGADLQTFLWTNGTPLPAQFGTFFYVGVQGRIDTGRPPSRNVATSF
jgi:hypothetical protein